MARARAAGQGLGDFDMLPPKKIWHRAAGTRRRPGARSSSLTLLNIVLSGRAIQASRRGGHWHWQGLGLGLGSSRLLESEAHVGSPAGAPANDAARLRVTV